jgi:hypothetical protein
VTVTTQTTLEIVSTFTPLPAIPEQFYAEFRVPSDAPAAAAAYQGLFLSPDSSFGQMSIRPRTDSTVILFTVNAATELVNAGPTGTRADHVAVAVPSNGQTVIVWDTRDHYADARVNFPFTTCTAVPSVLVPGAYKLQYVQPPISSHRVSLYPDSC